MVIKIVLLFYKNDIEIISLQYRMEIGVYITVLKKKNLKFATTDKNNFDTCCFYSTHSLNIFSSSL